MARDSWYQSPDNPELSIERELCPVEDLDWHMSSTSGRGGLRQSIETKSDRDHGTVV
ncbi:UNVERIFIED_CONTAM: hypothetical protein Sradi_0891300 [Sesamum radiatum]|uniref:Uncharacterized protein n=1 Tax=Sesamum radiatum TaxID=300843 RepID=A0AAW2V1E2_SESRA